VGDSYREEVKKKKKSTARNRVLPGSEEARSQALRKQYYAKSPAGRAKTTKALQMRLWG